MTDQDLENHNEIAQKIEKTGRSTNLGIRNSGTRMIKEQKQHELNLRQQEQYQGIHEHHCWQECEL